MNTSLPLVSVKSPFEPTSPTTAASAAPTNASAAPVTAAPSPAGASAAPADASAPPADADDSFASMLKPAALPPEFTLPAFQPPTHPKHDWRRLGLGAVLAGSVLTAGIPLAQKGMEHVAISREASALQNAASTVALRPELAAAEFPAPGVARAPQEVQLSPDGRFLLVGTQQGEVITRTADGGAQATLPDAHPWASAYLGDGRLLTWGDGSLQLRDPATGSITSSIPGAPVDGVSVSGNRVAFFSGHLDEPSVLHIAEATPHGLEHHSVHLQGTQANVATWSADGTRLAVVHTNGGVVRVSVVDARTGQEVLEHRLADNDYSFPAGSDFSVSLARDGSLLGVADRNTTSARDGMPARVVDVPTGRTLWERRNVKSLVFSPLRDTLILASSDDTVTVTDVNARDGHPLWDAHLKDLGDPSVQFSPDGSKLALSGYRSAYILDAGSGRGLWGVRANDDYHEYGPAPTFSPDGREVAVRVGFPDPSSYDGTTVVSVHDSATGEEIAQQKTAVHPSAAFSSDGKVLLLQTTDARDLHVVDLAHRQGPASPAQG